MKKFKIVFFIFSVIVIASLRSEATNPPDITDKIISALSTGNVSELSKYFNTNIELAILDKEDIYSSAQAEVIVKDFFEKNKPLKYAKVHQGGKEGSKFVIGNLTTSTGAYRVYFLVKDVKGKYLIHTLRFELPNEK
jgi:hypothetical protein